MTKEVKYYRVKSGERIAQQYAYTPCDAAGKVFDRWYGTEATTYTVEWYDQWNGKVETFIIDVDQYDAIERPARNGEIA